MKLIYSCYFFVAFLNGNTAYFFWTTAIFLLDLSLLSPSAPPTLDLLYFLENVHFAFFLLNLYPCFSSTFSWMFALRIFTYPLNDGSHITASEKTFFNFQTRSCLSIRYLLIPCALKKVQFWEQTWRKAHKKQKEGKKGRKKKRRRSKSRRGGGDNEDLFSNEQLSEKSLQLSYLCMLTFTLVCITLFFLNV